MNKDKINLKTKTEVIGYLATKLVKKKYKMITNSQDALVYQYLVWGYCERLWKKRNLLKSYKD